MHGPYFDVIANRLIRFEVSNMNFMASNKPTPIIFALSAALLWKTIKHTHTLDVCVDTHTHGMNVRRDTVDWLALLTTNLNCLHSTSSFKQMRGREREREKIIKSHYYHTRSTCVYPVVTCKNKHTRVTNRL